MYRFSFLFVCFWIICLFSTNSVNSPNIRQWEAHWPTSHSHLITSQRMLQRCAEFVYACCVFVNVLVFLCGFISLHVRPSICSLSSVPKEFVPNLPSGTVPYGPQGKYICQTCTNPLFHIHACVCVFLAHYACSCRMSLSATMRHFLYAKKKCRSGEGKTAGWKYVELQLK